MNRQKRREFLGELEKLISESGYSLSLVLAKLMSRGYTKKKFKTLAKRIHPWEYKNRYPLACELFTRVCYHKGDDLSWGQRVQKWSCARKAKKMLGIDIDVQKFTGELIDTIKERHGEFEKRFKGLIRMCADDDVNTQKILVLLEEEFNDPTELEALRKKLHEMGDTPHKETLEFTINSLILINKNKEAN